MIKDLVALHDKMVGDAKNFVRGGVGVSPQEVVYTNNLIVDYATKGAKIVLNTVKESDVVKVRNLLLKNICAATAVEGDLSLILAAKAGVLIEYTDTVVYAMIGVLYEEGVL